VIWRGIVCRASHAVDALGILAEVRQTATRLRSQPLLSRTEELERTARARGAGHEPWHPLSIREYEVARKIADGLTNVEIGAALFVSPKTLSAHVEHILAKLGVARRTEIAAWVATVAILDGRAAAAARIESLATH
jgi:DNA-binding CsgD family transcriptional regulator